VQSCPLENPGVRVLDDERGSWRAGFKEAGVHLAGEALSGQFVGGVNQVLPVTSSGFPLPLSGSSLGSR